MTDPRWGYMHECQRRWTPAQVRDIRRMFNRGATYKKVQAKHGGSLCALANVRQRITYKEVTDHRSGRTR